MLPLLVVAAGFVLAANSLPSPDFSQCGKKPLKPVVVDSDTCSDGGRSFRVLLVSPTGCDFTCDMMLTFDQQGRLVEARLPGKWPTTWWKLRPNPEERIEGPCRRVSALLLENSKVLLLLYADDRPGDDRRVAILYDMELNKVVDIKDLGPGGTITERDDRHLWFRRAELDQVGGPLVREPKDYMALPDGDQLVSVMDSRGPLNPVIRVWASDHEVHAEADLDRTYPNFVSFFANSKAFAKATSWNAKDMRMYVREGQTATGRKCMQLRVDRDDLDWRAPPWFCEAR